MPVASAHGRHRLANAAPDPWQWNELLVWERVCQASDMGIVTGTRFGAVPQARGRLNCAPGGCASVSWGVMTPPFWASPAMSGRPASGATHDAADAVAPPEP
jgi:hypothetical protein